MANYCVQADLEVAVGGAAVLVQLLDKDGDGVADATQVAACLARATAEVNSAISIAVDISALDSPYDDTLIYQTASIAAYHAWMQGGEGQVMPDSVRERHANAQDWLSLVATRRRTLGGTTRRATSQFVGEQVYASTEPWDSTSSPRARLKGMW